MNHIAYLDNQEDCNAIRVEQAGQTFVLTDWSGDDWAVYGRCQQWSDESEPRILSMDDQPVAIPRRTITAIWGVSFKERR